jgi:hypothetical protein
MNINSKKELKGKQFKCLRIVKGLTIDDIPAMRESYKAQISGITDASMTETDTAFEFSNGQFVVKPKQEKETIGILDCTKSYAMFDGVRIEYTDMQDVFASCFETTNAQFAIHAII